MCKKKAPEYAGVFEELSNFDGIIVRGSQMVIPDSLRADAIGWHMRDINAQIKRLIF